MRWKDPRFWERALGTAMRLFEAIARIIDGWPPNLG